MNKYFKGVYYDFLKLHAIFYLRNGIKFVETDTFKYSVSNGEFDSDGLYLKYGIFKEQK